MDAPDFIRHCEQLSGGAESIPLRRFYNSLLEGGAKKLRKPKFSVYRPTQQQQQRQKKARQQQQFQRVMKQMDQQQKQAARPKSPKTTTKKKTKKNVQSALSQRRRKQLRMIRGGESHTR